MWAQVARSRRLVEVDRELLPTPDGDEVVLDHLRDGAGRSPRLLVLHGLEGSTFSSYAQGMLALAASRGLGATVFNFRSCARRLDDRKTWIPNRRPRLYHSGETSDLDHVVRTLSGREPEVPLLAVGVSLGGNVLLKWLGEHPDQIMVRAAATISVPYDLGVGARYLRRPMGRVYFRHFHATLVAKLSHLLSSFTEVRELVDIRAARRARDFVAYDAAATAPLHGFESADDYYERSSAVGFVGHIATPTLCVSAADDPFLPSSVLDRVRDVASDAVDLRVSPAGGHVGFVSGTSPRHVTYWAETTVLDWLETAERAS